MGRLTTHVLDTANGKPVAGVEVHGRSDEGKLVVTVEDTPERRCIDTVTSLMDVKGVLSTTIVYQHTETDDEDSSAESVQ